MSNANATTSAYSEDDAINKVHRTLLSPQQSGQCEATLKTGKPPTRIFLIALLIILLGSSARPDQLSFESRLQSFSNIMDPNGAELWAEQGFYLDSTGASCFHCGAHTDKLGQDPVELHPRLCHDCNLLSLLRFLSAKSPALAHDMIVTGAARFEKLLMNSLVALNGSISRFVQSFGFTIEQVALALVRFFINSDGRLQLRPGDLMELTEWIPPDAVQYVGADIIALLQGFESVAPQIAPNSMADAGSLSRIREAAAANDIGTNNNAQNSYRVDGGASAIRQHDQPVTEQATLKQEDSDSPLCMLCKMKGKDRVLLPCAHLVLCRVCAQHSLHCPACGTAVVCFLPAFIT